MKSSPTSQSIGELADAVGVEAHVLRHWESFGLLTPQRRNGRRVYNENDSYRVAAIQRGKAAHLSLKQIRELIAATEPRERSHLLEQHRGQLQDQAAAIEQAINMINSVLNCDHEDFTQCPTFRAFVTDNPSPEQA